MGQRKEGYYSCLSISQIDLKEFPSEAVFNDVHHRWVVGKQVTGKSGLPSLGQECSQSMGEGLQSHLPADAACNAVRGLSAPHPDWDLAGVLVGCKPGLLFLWCLPGFHHEARTQCTRRGI